MLKDELSEIVGAESASSERLSASIASINKEKQILQERLYQELKAEKAKIQREQQTTIEAIKQKTNQWYEDELAKVKRESLQAYQEILTKKAKVISDLSQYMWQVPVEKN